MNAPISALRTLALSFFCLANLHAAPNPAGADSFSPDDCKDAEKARQIVAELEKRQDVILQEDAERNAKLNKLLEQKSAQAGMDRAARSRFMTQLLAAPGLQAHQAERKDLSKAINHLMNAAENNPPGSPQACSHMVLGLTLAQKLRELNQKEHEILLQEINKLGAKNKPARREPEPDSGRGQP
ncbi:hypothetical protein V8J88_05870 [Massilia sp. W12]|uniref:hypothetical protein n=1 Tax=Massilia sp. W12 TaxID=3126507 RepID=UPI0030CCDE2E